MRAPRPVLVELATAMLIVAGVLSVLTSIEAVAQMADRGAVEPSVALLSVAIGLASVVLGLLLRTGRAWLVGVNLAAIAGFLELTSGSVVGLLYGLLDVFVVLALVWSRGWFRSALDAADREPADEVALEEEEHEGHGQREQDREGRELGPASRAGELSDHAVEGDR
jgi:hypothetical protein